LGHIRRAIEEEFSRTMTKISLLAAAAAPSAGASFFVQTIPLVLIFVIFWFLLIRPQQKRMKEHQAQIGAVKKGDRVVTGGGLIGKVTKVTDTEVEVELAQGIRVNAVKSTLTQVIDPTAAKPAND
jgi:preprotein translocase subunit YajC